MLTVFEALQLNSLEGAKLVAGKSGVKRTIKWITTIEIIEDITRFHDGEFVVTTGYDLLKNKYYEKRMIDLIHSRKPSAIALYTGFYIDKIPEKIIAAANKHDIPLIEIPSTINFSTITKSIVEQIGNEQMKLLEESLNIHKEMTKLAINKDGLDEVLAKLSPLTSCSLFVYDDLGHLQAANMIHSSIVIDHPHGICIENATLLVQQLFIYANKIKKPFIFHQIEFHCYCAPIKDDTFTYGFFVAIREKKYWTDMDEIIMDHVATLIGIELVKQYAIEETKIRLQGELVEELLMKEQLNKTSAIQRGKKLGFDLRKNHVVLYFKVMTDRNGSIENNDDFSTQLLYVVSQTFSKTGRQTIFLPKLNALFALVEVKLHEIWKEKKIIISLAKEIYDKWIHYFKKRLFIGIGNHCDDIIHLSMSAKEAEYAVQYAPLLLKEKFIVHFDDLGFYQILIRMQEAGISLIQFYKTYLGNLIEEKRRTDLLLTLETYLANNCNMQQTAAKLFVHRHTLKYRLQQIEKRTGLCLQSPDDRLNLHLAILAYKFVQLQKRYE